MVLARNLPFLILAILPAAYATEAAHEFYNLDVLKNLTDAGKDKILEISSILEKTPNVYWNLTAERFDCLHWECDCQEKNVKKSTADTVIKGLSKNAKFSSFQCISNTSRDTLDKLNAACSRLPENSEEVVKKGLGTVMPYTLLMPGFDKYVRDLYEKKKEELSKASSEESKKILLEVQNKMKFLLTVLEGMKTQMETLKNKFFETYVRFAYETENSLRKIQKEGTQKISKCVG